MMKWEGTDFDIDIGSSAEQWGEGVGGRIEGGEGL